MSFLNPMAIAIAAGLTIPPLVALYFLKLKRAVRLVPSTLLWKRAIEDLQVNAPFQRLRSSLLLLLQLLVLILAALALGKPMFQTARTHKDNVIILVDQSASMGVIEADGVSRLEQAKTQAKRCVENMDDDARAMVIAFCDRAWVVSSFDTDKKALMRKINSIEQTQSTSTLGEAMSLAEAFTQNITIGGAEAGSDIAPEAPASPASVFLFTDGRIADAHQVALQKFDAASITVTRIGTRNDNAGIITMAARRGYERPESLEVTATVRNFAPEAIDIDVVLYVGGRHLDVQTLSLKGADRSLDAPGAMLGEPSVGSVGVVAFDRIEFGGAGIVEVVLQVDDALPADNHAWTIIEEPRSLRVLLVTEGNLFLENVLQVLPLDLHRMSPGEYERASDEDLILGDRSAFDVVIIDQHSTARLPRGNYLFWAGVPKLEGVTVGGVIDDQVIFNWDETHPLLRHVAVETLSVYEWLRLDLPPEAVSIIDGETTPVLSYLTRDGSQYVISAFGLLAKDEFGTPLMNTYWVTSVDFVVFMQNAVTFLASNQATLGRKSVAPGDPVTLPLSKKVEVATVIRPDETRESVLSAPRQLIHYARTRQVGTYRIEPGVPGNDQFAVNLFSEVESDVSPAPRLTLGTSVVEAQAASIEVSQPAWPYFLIAILVLLLFEWIVYNKRVLV